jgi:endo-1,4-beta-xylanase
MRTKRFEILAVGIALGLVHCGPDETSVYPGDGEDSGGSAAAGAGGSSNGGAVAGGVGGVSGAAGSNGGAVATGGNGAAGAGGIGSGGTGSGGDSSGGSGVGGSGNDGSGGATAGAGRGGQGGAGAAGRGGAGGKAGAGGRGGSGAGAGAGGKGGTGAGGAGAGQGGSGTGGIPNTCTEANRTLTSNGTGRHCNYTYEYWKDQGSGSLVLRSDGFSVDWSNINNLLGRKGVRPGSANLVATYEADYQPNGNSYLCIYGWTRNPLVEYYIVDSWGTWRPPGSTSLGTVQSDGGTYDIYRTQRVNQPSIDGTRTFDQYWSVRTTKRTSGSITVSNHVNAWAGKGMNMGSFYEVSMTVEGYQSSGNATVRMVIR